MSTILIGVETSERSRDAIAFGRRLATAAGADVIVANAYPYSDLPSRASNAAYREALRDNALETVEAMRQELGEVGAPAEILVAPNVSPAHALHRIAEVRDAALIIVGSTHTGRAGRVLPGSTGERLIHGSPCAVAVVPREYRSRADEPIKRIGVAYNSTEEADAALAAGIELARGLGAELEVIGVVSAESFGTPALMSGGPSPLSLRADIENKVQQSLDAMLGEVPSDVAATSVRLTGDPADELAARSTELDLLVTGSRGYGPLHSVLVGGVSARIMRSAACPVIAVPRGVEAPLEHLFGSSTATTA